MGHFSQTCSLTGAHISGGAAIIILTVPEQIGGTTEISVLPTVIRGTYDTYGGIRDIRSTPGTQALERYFQMSIEELCAYVVDIRENPYDLYSEHSKLLIPEVKEFLSDHRIYVGDDKFLPYFGFVKSNETAGEESEWTMEQHPFIQVKLSKSMNSQYYTLLKGSRRVGFHHVTDTKSFLRDLSEVLGTAVGVQGELLWKKVLLDKIRHFWVKGSAFKAFSRPLKSQQQWYGANLYFGMDSIAFARLGFVEREREYTADEPEYYATHPDLPGYYLEQNRSIGHYAPVLYNHTGSPVLVFDKNQSLPRLLKHLKKLTGVELPFNLSAEKRITPKRAQILHVLTKVDRFKSRDDTDDDPESPLLDSLRWGEIGSEAFGELKRLGSGWNFIKDVFWKEFLSGQLTDELEAVRYLRHNMYLFAAEPKLRTQPPQDGDYAAQRELGHYLIKDADAELKNRCY
jgi:hypothetical protein